MNLRPKALSADMKLNNFSKDIIISLIVIAIVLALAIIAVPAS